MPACVRTSVADDNVQRGGGVWGGEWGGCVLSVRCRVPNDFVQRVLLVTCIHYPGQFVFARY